MNRTPIRNSSSIVSEAYDPETRTLELQFASLAVYQYYQVPPSIYRAFQVAGSKGHFHALYLAGKYEYKCVVPRPTGDKSHGDPDKKKSSQVQQVKAQVKARAEKNQASQHSTDKA